MLQVLSQENEKIKKKKYKELQPMYSEKGERLFIWGDFREYKWKKPQDYKGSISFI